MTFHPLGPWTSSQPFQAIPKSGILWYASGSNPRQTTNFPPRVLASTNIRTGVNNGKRISTVSPASRVIVGREDLRNFKCKGRTFYAPLKTWYSYDADCYATLSPNTNVSTNRASEAQAKSFQKLIAKQGAVFQALPFLGEFKETMESARNITKTLTGAHNEATKSFVKQIQRNKLYSLPAITRLVSDLWLEYNFSIVPTIKDFDNLLNATAQAIAKPPRLKKIHASEKLFDSISDTLYSVYSMGFIQLRYKTVSTVNTISKIGFSFKTEATVRDAAPPQSLFGLELGDVVPALWEITPYSWLVDYVTNASDYFNLLSLHRCVSENGWIVSIRDERNVLTFEPTFHTLFGGSDPRPVENIQSGATLLHKFSFNRDVFDIDTYIPDFRFEVPNLRQSANVAALAASKFVRPGRLDSLFSSARAQKINDVLRALPPLGSVQRL